MKKYFKYLKYVIRHKYYVIIECFKVGLYWRGIMHDMSKFRPSEFIPYARYFNGNYPTEEACRRARQFQVALGKSKEQIKEDFDFAWLKHIHRNKHHWQFWILREDCGKNVYMDMDTTTIFEMICDWRGAGKAIHGHDETEEWYLKNKDKMRLSKKTREHVERIINL